MNNYNSTNEGWNEEYGGGRPHAEEDDVCWYTPRKGRDMITNSELVSELRAMQELGVKVDDRTLNHAYGDDLSGYEGIGVEQLASLFCELYNWT